MLDFEMKFILHYLKKSNAVNQNMNVSKVFCYFIGRLFLRIEKNFGGQEIMKSWNAVSAPSSDFKISKCGDYVE